MKKILLIVGWIGVVILGILDLGNPNSYDHKPDEERTIIVGIFFLLILVVLVSAVSVHLLR